MNNTFIPEGIDDQTDAACARAYEKGFLDGTQQSQHLKENTMATPAKIVEVPPCVVPGRPKLELSVEYEIDVDLADLIEGINELLEKAREYGYVRSAVMTGIPSSITFVPS